jgi:hypothetical protein
MAKIEKKTKRYPSDLTNEEWARIDLQSSSTAQPGAPSWAHPYGSALRAPQEHAGYGGTVSTGQFAPENVPVIRQPGGVSSAFVNGHRVLVDPNTNRVIRVLN